jgi:drug/metabolite transporter (DMT)-like permease
MASNLILLLTAVIWGFAFVAQRVGMSFIGPFTYNGVRFALGALSLVPLLLLTCRSAAPGSRSLRKVLPAGLLLGLFLFAGSSFQQVGIVTTTAGKAGFITGLYVVFVPLMGLLWGQRTRLFTWIGALLAATGLYFLSVSGDFTIASGDLLEIAGAFFWACHVHLISHYAKRIDPLALSVAQFVVNCLLSVLAALLFEHPQPAAIGQAWLPILYGGILSVGIAYTLQIVAQRKAHPAHASIILSLEGAFAALGGWWILGEMLTLRSLTGCGLMLSGMLLSQAGSGKEDKTSIEVQPL